MLQLSPWKKILIALICLAGVLYSLPNVAGSQWMQANLPSWMPGKTVNLGLDLRGGAHLLYDVDVNVVFEERADLMVSDLRKDLRKEKIGYKRLGKTPDGVRITLREEADGEEVRKILRKFDPNLEIETNEDVIVANFGEASRQEIYDQTLAQSIEIVRRRIDELGTTEPVIQRQGENRILIQAPGGNAEDLKGVIGTTAKLTFHLLAEQGEVDPRNTLVLPLKDNELISEKIYKKPEISGDMLDNAQVSFQQGETGVTLRFNAVGARKFFQLTQDHLNERFAIVLDNEILSAPVMRAVIVDGVSFISGSFDVASASELALLLRSGALPAPMHVVEERTVGPSLGADSVDAGKNAALIGLAFVLVFMIISYGTFGFFANIALLVNVGLIFALLSILQATLTLPGIAGIVLTVGMAVDANVLIFERIREEFRTGRSAIASIDSGYRNAMSTIVDSNLTTLIAALILFSFGTGPIKGFAVTLGVGIVTSFFSAVMVTRLLIVLWLRNRTPKEIPV